MTGPIRFALLVCVASSIPLQAAELPVVPPAEVGLSAERLTAVDRFMEQQVQDKKIAGGIVMVARNGKVGLFRTYGQQDIENNKPMDKQTIFRLYSMSKAITTAAALTLVDAGKLKLDDPVSKFIPAFREMKVKNGDGLRPPTREMTVQDLMLHTAGLTYAPGPLFAPNLEAMCEQIAKMPLAYDPGTDWTYSFSIDVLGRVVEVVSGQPLDQFFQKTLFEPLGMVDTGFSVPESKVARFAANYNRGKDGLKLADSPTKSNFAKKVTLFSGGGGLVGTASDYMRFLLMIENGGSFEGKQILQPETVKKMTTNQLPKEVFPIHFGKDVRHGTGFSLGFSVRAENTEKWDPAGRLGEYGWGGAASTHYWISPKDRLIVVTLEQIMPYQWDTEFGLKKIIYDAIEK